jgi:hypothetical protein
MCSLVSLWEDVLGSFYARKLVTSCIDDEVSRGRNSFSCHVELADDAPTSQKAGLTKLHSSINKVTRQGNWRLAAEQHKLGPEGLRAKGPGKIASLLDKLLECAEGMEEHLEEKSGVNDE